MRKALRPALLAMIAAVIAFACAEPVEPGSDKPAVEDHEFDAGQLILIQIVILKICSLLFNLLVLI